MQLSAGICAGSLVSLSNLVSILWAMTSAAISELKSDKDFRAVRAARPSGCIPIRVLAYKISYSMVLTRPDEFKQVTYA